MAGRDQSAPCDSDDDLGLETGVDDRLGELTAGHTEGVPREDLLVDEVGGIGVVGGHGGDGSRPRAPAANSTGGRLTATSAWWPQARQNAQVSSLRIGVVCLHTDPFARPGAGDVGGMNVVVRSTTAAMAAAGHEVTVWTRRDRDDVPLRETGRRRAAAPAARRPSDDVAQVRARRPHRAVRGHAASRARCRPAALPPLVLRDGGAADRPRARHPPPAVLPQRRGSAEHAALGRGAPGVARAPRRRGLARADDGRDRRGLARGGTDRRAAAPCAPARGARDPPRRRQRAVPPR